MKVVDADITWLVHLFGAVLLVIGVGLLVYNVLGLRAHRYTAHLLG